MFNLFTRPAQLRTPSPSINDGEQDKESTPTPNPNPVALDLAEHIQSIPPQTLHSYTLQNLALATPTTSRTLHTFFNSLQPPPLLHCVRCHSAYTEIENTDRSCTVNHDDDSAEVERGKGGYVTLWSCCGKFVEGDGDQGPPDGWCFEGAHTTDLKRARFREDSTMHDDKLVQCETLRCFPEPTPEPGSPSSSVSSLKRTISQVDLSAGPSEPKPRSKATPKTTPRAKPVSTASTTTSKNAKSTPKLRAKSIPSSPKPEPKPRPKPRPRRKKTADEEAYVMQVDEHSSEEDEAPVNRRKSEGDGRKKRRRVT